MNVDLLIKTIKKNFHRIKDLELTLKFVKYHIELLEWKKKKLKLGAIVFEVKETYFNGILIIEEVDIRYIKQDNTDTDNLKIENRLKAIGWKWDLKNFAALVTVIILTASQLYNYAYSWYCKNLPTLAYRSEHYDLVIKHGIENAFFLPNFGAFKKTLQLNYWLVDTVTDFCIYFNILL